MNTKINLNIQGMHCASCVGRIEKVISKVPGVSSVAVNLATEKAHIEGSGLDPATLIAAVEDIGYSARSESQENTERKIEEKPWTLIFSVALTLPLILGMFTGTMLPGMIQFILATIVQIGAGAKFYVSAWKNLKQRSANMDTLIALGTTAAWGLSVFELFIRGSHHLYFESSATIITLVLLGKVLEARAKGKTLEAIAALRDLRPDEVRILREGVEVKVGPQEVIKGQIAIIHPGEKISVDGVIRKGQTEVDLSLLTGESLPVERHEGEEVFAGSLNGNGSIHVEVTRLAQETRLARIIEVVEDAQTKKAPIQKMADKVSSIFVPTILIISLITLVATALILHNWEEALLRAVAVLVIACPCSLGLATPTAIMVGTGVAAKFGILIKDAEALETTQSLNLVVFDKTGTLTKGSPEVSHFKNLHGAQEKNLSLLGGLQSSSHHPLARATLRFLHDKDVKAKKLDSVENIPGKGIRGVLGDRTLALGSARLVRELGLSQGFESKTETTSYLVDVSQRLILMEISFKDQLKPEAKETIERLQAKKIKTILLTGDTQSSADELRDFLNLNEARGDLLPEDKLSYIRQYKTSYHVGMVGDGINDAPALTEAHVGLAMSTGTDVAVSSSGITLMQGNLLLVVRAIEVSQKTFQKIKQNLFWAFIFNLIGIPLAALGYLNPTIAGAAMALSSVTVVSNSLLLKKGRFE